MAKKHSTLEPQIVKISPHERFYRVNRRGLSLRSGWLAQAGFTRGMSVKIRVMPGCIILTAQNFNELWQCLEGLSATPLNVDVTTRWLVDYPGGWIERVESP